MPEQQPDERLNPPAAELQKANALLTEEIERLRESEEKFKTIFENANDHIVYMGTDGIVIDVNPKVEDLFGYKREEVIGKKFYEFGALTPQDWQRCIDLSRDLIEGKAAQPRILELEAKRKDGTVVFIEVNPRLVVKDGEIKGILTICRDITARKREEALLRQHRDELERLVRERTSNLEEANTALRVMLQKAEEFKKESEDRVALNVRESVLPYLQRLRRSRLNAVQKTYLDEMESNLMKVAAPSAPGVSVQYFRLSPAEIKVVNLIREGKSTRDIAAALGMAVRTVDAHRRNIRRKLGLQKSGMNLRTYLLSST